MIRDGPLPGIEGYDWQSWTPRRLAMFKRHRMRAAEIWVENETREYSLLKIRLTSVIHGVKIVSELEN
jgi:hypothetical protein